MTTRRMQKVPQFRFSDQLIQVVPKVPTIFCSMSVVLVVLTIQTLIALHRVSNHLIQPLEEWPILDFLQNLMYQFFEYSVTFCVLVDPYCPVKSLLGLLLLYWSDLKSLPFWGITFSFPFPYRWSSSTLLYLSIRSISCRTLVTGLPIKDFLKPCSVGRPLLNVLMATSSKLSSISLYISQYLSEYALRVSLSCMDNDNNKLRGRGTLVFVMKRKPKAWVSYL